MLDKVKAAVPSFSSDKPDAGIGPGTNNLEHGYETTLAGSGPLTARQSKFARVASDDSRSKLKLALLAFHVFLPFINVWIYIGNAAMQAKEVGVSLLIAFGVVVNFFTLAVASLLLATHLYADRVGFLSSVDRAMRQVRFATIVLTLMVSLAFAMVIATTASANAAGCKDPTKDPNFDNEQWRDQLPEFCRNKRASAAFFWFSWFAWTTSLALVLRRWREIRKNPVTTSFTPPAQSMSDEEAFNPGPDAYDGMVTPLAADLFKDQHAPVDSRGDGLYEHGAGGDAKQAPTSTYNRPAPPHYDNEEMYRPQARDPFNDPEPAYSQSAYEAHDPYEQIRKTMDTRSQSPRY